MILHNCPVSRACYSKLKCPYQIKRKQGFSFASAVKQALGLCWCCSTLVARQRDLDRLHLATLAAHSRNCNCQAGAGAKFRASLCTKSFPSCVMCIQEAHQAYLVAHMPTLSWEWELSKWFLFGASIIVRLLLLMLFGIDHRFHNLPDVFLKPSIMALRNSRPALIDSVPTAVREDVSHE